MSKKKKNTLLWELSVPSEEKKCYLFGSIHISDSRVFLFDDLVKQAIDKCDVFQSEFRIYHARLDEVEECLQLPEGTYLDDILKPRAYQRVSELLYNKTGLLLENFRDKKPLVIIDILDKSLMRTDMPLYMDGSFVKYARSKNKILSGVETFQEQLNTLQRIPIEAQAKTLVWISKNFKKHKKQIEKTIQYYIQADLNKLAKMAKVTNRETRQLLLFDRNRLMAHRIDISVRATKTSCMVIGAGHLGGEKGVLRYLKQKGIKVKPANLE